MRENNKLKQMIIDSLTYCRLHADLAAIEAEMEENKPLPKTEESSLLKKLYNKTIIPVHNGIRKLTVDELEKEGYAAKAECKRFEEGHTEKELSLFKDLDKVKALIQKKLLRKDDDLAKKTSLAFAIIMDDQYVYQRPEQSLQAVSSILFDDPAYMQTLYDSLCENFKRVQGDLLPAVDVLSSFPTLGNAGLRALLNRGKKKRFQANLEKLSTSQVGALFAAKLTALQQAKAAIPADAWEDLADDILKYIQNVRADAEYKFVFDIIDGGVADQICALCVHAVERLAEIHTL